MATTLAHPPPPSTAPPSVRLGGGSSLAQIRSLREERGRRRRARWRANQDGMHNGATAVGRHNDGGGGGCRGGRPFTAAAGGYGRTTVNSGIVGGDCVEVEPTRRRISPRQRRRVEETHAYLCAKVDPVMGALILALVSDHPTDVRDAALRHLLVSREKKRNISSANSDGVAAATVHEADISRLNKNNACNSRAAVGVSGPKYSVGVAEGGCCSSDGGTCGGKGELSMGNGCRDGNSGRDTVGNAVGRLAQRRDRLFMAREIGPLVTELINRTLRHMPTDVESFLIEQLQGAARTQTPAVKEYPNEPKTPQGSTGSSHLERERHNDMYRSDRGGNYTDSAKPASPMVTPRPSTARNRLKQAQNMDLAVQRNSPPQEDRTERRSPSPPRRPDLSTDPGDRVVAEGVRESKNKPWDVEVASKANLPPSHIEASPGEMSATSGNKNPRLAVVLLLGIDGAGKTTLLGTLQGDHDPRVRPSVGFKPVTMMLSDQLKVKFYDLGGGEKIRSIWNNYFHDAHGVVYMVDGADRSRWEESKEHFFVAMNHRHLRGKPVAVILNKEDAGLQLAPTDVAEELGLSTQNTGKVWCCSANSARATGGMPDARLEGAVEWLLENVQENFSALNERVQRDLQDMEKEFQREKERKQLAVLRGLLRKAFPEAEGAEREDCFDKREGVEFLTSEVGLDEGTLPAEGEEIAGLVGYQKLALQMVGNMKSPISRKNRARSWEEIRNLILHLRQEIGID